MSSVNSVMSDATEVSLERPDSPENLAQPIRKRGRKAFQLRGSFPETLLKNNLQENKSLYQRTTFSDFQLTFLQKRFEEKRYLTVPAKGYKLDKFSISII